MKRLFGLLGAWVLASGCTAIHVIEIDSEPPGAHIEINGDYVGPTPLAYELKSPLAEKIWPWETTVVAQKVGWRTESKDFAVRDKLPQRIMFVLQSIDPAAAAAAEASRREAPPDVDPYETLEQRKARLLREEAERRERESQGGEEPPRE